MFCSRPYRPLSRRLDHCNRMTKNESRDPNSGNVYYVTMQITFPTRKFRNVERNLHCDIVHITKKKGKGMFLYSAVSSPLDRSKRFTLFAHPDRPVHSDTNSASPGSILATQQLRATTKHSHFHHCL